MIEKKFVAEKMKEFLVNSYLFEEMGAGKFSSFEIKRTPLGEKVVIYTSRPGLVVGKKGENIKKLTKVLKSRFKMENPQIEVSEITNPNLDPQAMAEQIVTTLERFGPKRFKSVGYRTLQRIMDAGAMGSEIIISGRGIPGSRAKSWRFYAGYLKKSGDVAVSIIKYGKCVANLKSGTIGIKVKVLPGDAILPDKIDILEIKKTTIEVEEIEVEEDKAEEKKTTEDKEEKKKKVVKKKVVKKKVAKKVAKKKEEKTAKEEVKEEKTEAVEEK
jgi:small subunit ribosomal protein S3